MNKTKRFTLLILPVCVKRVHSKILNNSKLLQKEWQFYTHLWPVLLCISIDQNLKVFLENYVFANDPDQFGFTCKIFFQFYSSLWLNQDYIIAFLVTGLQNHKQTKTQTTTATQQTENPVKRVHSTESNLNCCNSCCLWTAQTSLRNACMMCRNAIVSFLLFFFQSQASFFFQVLPNSFFGLLYQTQN